MICPFLQLILVVNAGNDHAEPLCWIWNRVQMSEMLCIITCYSQPSSDAVISTMKISSLVSTLLINSLFQYIWWFLYPLYYLIT